MLAYISNRLGLPSTFSTTQQYGDNESLDRDDLSTSGRSLSLPWPVTESRTKTSSSKNPVSLNSINAPLTMPFTGSTHSLLLPRRTGSIGKSISISNPIPRTQPNILTASFDSLPSAPSTSNTNLTPIPSSSTSIRPSHISQHPSTVKETLTQLPSSLPPPTTEPLPEAQPQHPQPKQEADIRGIAGVYEYERAPSRRGLYRSQQAYLQGPINMNMGIPTSHSSYPPNPPPEVVRLDSGSGADEDGDGDETVVGEISENDNGTTGKKSGSQRRKKGNSNSRSPGNSPYAYSPPVQQYEYTSHPTASSYALPLIDETRSITSIKSGSSAKSTSTGGSTSSTVANLKRALSNPFQNLVGGPNKSSTPIPSPEFYASPFTVNDRDSTHYRGRYSHSETPSLSNASSRSELDASKLDAFPPVPESHPLGFITKSRWNHSLNTNINALNLHINTPVTQTFKERPKAMYQINNKEAYESEEEGTRTPMAMSMLNITSSSMQVGHHPHKKPVPAPILPLTLPMPIDVYGNAYNYPLAKQLSPIAEQDYISPTTAAASDNQSLKFGFGDGGSLRLGTEYERMRKETGGSRTGSVSGKSFSIKEKDSIEKKDVLQGDKVVVVDQTMNIEREVAKETKTRNGSGRSGSGGSVSDITRPSPIYTPTSASGSSPFITRHLNRTVSQTSSKSDVQQVYQVPLQQTPPMTHVVPRAIASLATQVQNRDALPPTTTVMTPISQTPTSAATTTMYTPTSTFEVQTPVGSSMPNVAGTGPNANPYPVQIQIPSPAVLNSKDTPSATYLPPSPVSETLDRYQEEVSQATPRVPKIPSLPTIPPLDLRFSIFGSVNPRRNSRDVRTSIMPPIDSVEDDEEEYEEEDDIDDEVQEDEDDEYDHESLHADSFVTADGRESIGLHLIPPSPPKPPLDSGFGTTQSLKSNSLPTLPRGASPSPGAPLPGTGDSFIMRRWDQDAPVAGNRSSTGSSPDTPATFRAKAKDTFSHYTPAFWAFWLGFIFPVLWIIGGWHFTHRGELPPRYTVWEWYFWRVGAGWFSWLRLKRKTMDPEDDRQTGKRMSRTGSESNVTKRNSKRSSKGKARVTGAQDEATSPSQGAKSARLPRWVAERQSTDDGRLRRLTHDPKRSLRGISFGYPFLARPANLSLPSAPRPSRPFDVFFNTLDLLHGVRLREVDGKPETARRMFDPWIQRCRYALCLDVIILAVGMLVACIYLIVVVV